MESKLIDWHPADIIAGLRKKGTSMAAESRRNGLEFIHAGQCINASVAERRVDYRESIGNGTLGYLAIALSRSAHA
ncbi:transcriptional regulator [Salmonella enterica subsp. enterica]|nr:transcriptional regulator [Salmonella enterica subsp. enterica]